MPLCLLVFSKFFQKNSDDFVETDHTSEKFFKRKLELAKGKDDGLHGMTSCCSFKAPSANASAAMAQRLASTSLVFDFHLTSFQEPLSDRQDSGPKKYIHEQNPGWAISRTFRVPGGCERMVALSGSKGPGLTTLTPPRLRSTA
jgi:hypothetical protein